MPDEQAIYEEMKELIIQGESQKAAELAGSHLETMDPLAIIENGLAPAMDESGISSVRPRSFCRK